MRKFIGIVLSLVMVIACFAGCTPAAEKPIDYTINPAEEVVVAVLNSIDGVFLIDCVTEDNDPNGQLHKEGGYTATVYFQHEFVETDVVNTDGREYYEEFVRTDDTIKGGTDAGGCIEVYATKEDAEQRNEYLSCFDGTIFCGGSHVVLGTMVIRTSNLITATHQDELTNNIVNAFNSVYGKTLVNGAFEG